jgi:hypothetical protein
MGSTKLSLDEVTMINTPYPTSLGDVGYVDWLDSRVEKLHGRCEGDISHDEIYDLFIKYQGYGKEITDELERIVEDHTKEYVEAHLAIRIAGLIPDSGYVYRGRYDSKLPTREQIVMFHNKYPSLTEDIENMLKFKYGSRVMEEKLNELWIKGGRDKIPTVELFIQSRCERDVTSKCETAVLREAFVKFCKEENITDFVVYTDKGIKSVCFCVTSFGKELGRILGPPETHGVRKYRNIRLAHL